MLMLVYYLRKYTWNLFFYICYNIYYFILFLIDKKVREKYYKNKELWESIKNFDLLIYFFREIYRYKFDGFLGMFDFDTNDFLFFIRFGDCDDVAVMVLKKLKEFGIDGHRVLFKGDGLFDWHFDVLFYDDNKWHLFNYGYIITDKSFDCALEKLLKLYNFKKYFVI